MLSLFLPQIQYYQPCHLDAIALKICLVSSVTSLGTANASATHFSEWRSTTSQTRARIGRAGKHRQLLLWFFFLFFSSPYGLTISPSMYGYNITQSPMWLTLTCLISNSLQLGCYSTFRQLSRSYASCPPSPIYGHLSLSTACTAWSVHRSLQYIKAFSCTSIS